MCLILDEKLDVDSLQAKKKEKINFASVFNILIQVGIASYDKIKGLPLYFSVTSYILTAYN